MQWSCPHCGINLAVTDDVLGSGWSFSRCYKCGGFALIRRTEINVIKVDKAPPGEKVILPEASGDPSTAMLPETATKKLAKHTSGKLKAEKTQTTYAPSITQAHATAASANTNQMTSPLPTQASPAPVAPTKMNVAGYDITSTLLPEPLPELNIKSSKTIPVGIAVAGVLAISSGIFLYIQGKALWNKTQEAAYESQTISSSKNTSASVTEKKEAVPAPHLLEEDSATTAATQVNPTQTLALAPKTNPSVITDQLQQSAMAPLKNIPAASASSGEEAKASVTRTFQVKIRTGTANLHSGPGVAYPIVATANPDTRYIVIDWSDRWFKLSTQTGPAAQVLGWVRNDLVQVLK